MNHKKDHHEKSNWKRKRFASLAIKFEKSKFTYFSCSKRSNAQKLKNLKQNSNKTEETERHNI